MNEPSKQGDSRLCATAKHKKVDLVLMALMLCKHIGLLIRPMPLQLYLFTILHSFHFSVHSSTCLIRLKLNIVLVIVSECLSSVQGY